jgi:ABC-type branched-subunit amino acid transport system permease subunit
MNNPNSMFARARPILFGALFLIGLIAPFAVYPTFLMKILCFALFACAFNLLLGFAGLLSFGHAAFLGTRATSAADGARRRRHAGGGHPRRHRSPRARSAGCSACWRSAAPASTSR